MRHLSRATLGLILAGGAASVVATATPATALATPLLAPAIGIPTAASYNVVPQCNAGPGVAMNLSQITYVIIATAESYATDLTPAVATGVTCKVVDEVTGDEYGSASAALPGPAAVAVAPVTVPLNGRPRLCGSANAIFVNNVTATATTLRPC